MASAYPTHRGRINSRTPGRWRQRGARYPRRTDAGYEAAGGRPNGASATYDASGGRASCRKYQAPASLLDGLPPVPDPEEVRQVPREPSPREASAVLPNGSPRSQPRGHVAYEAGNRPQIPTSPVSSPGEAVLYPDPGTGTSDGVSTSVHRYQAPVRRGAVTGYLPQVRSPWKASSGCPRYQAPGRQRAGP